MLILYQHLAAEVSGMLPKKPSIGNYTNKMNLKVYFNIVITDKPK
jgi:hypothetical protein